MARINTSTQQQNVNCLPAIKNEKEDKAVAIQNTLKLSSVPVNLVQKIVFKLIRRCAIKKAIASKNTSEKNNTIKLGQEDIQVSLSLSPVCACVCVCVSACVYACVRAFGSPQFPEKAKHRKLRRQQDEQRKGIQTSGNDGRHDHLIERINRPRPLVNGALTATLSQQRRCF